MCALIFGERAANSMALARETNKQKAAYGSNACRQHHQPQLIAVVCRLRTKAVDNVLIEQNKCHENHYGHQSMEKINELELILVGLLFRKLNLAIHHLYPSKCSHPVSDLASFVPMTIGERKKETHAGAERHEAEQHVLANLGSAPTVVC
ncbi:hypothetical protein V6N13_149315 [Hibiscus sabdariffa]|uniref:Uncharacterized protein n=1 Tax=Hibiscus sabdariffa TaxID=183260 RepID=A0ABR2EHN2_9ROSI